MPDNVTESDVIGDIVLYEEPSDYSRNTVTIVSGAGELVAGTVLGERTKTTATATADGGNTGDGTSGAVTLGANAQIGTYTLTCIEANTNAGTFQVIAPDGSRLADLTVGTAYASTHLNVTISDGATDFIVGDEFTVAVSGDGKFDAHEYGAVNGLGTATAVLLEDVDATSADVSDVLVLERDAIVSAPSLTYDSSVDNDTKRAAAVADLLAVGIKTTQGA